MATGVRTAAIPCPQASCFLGAPSGLVNSRGVLVPVYPPANYRPYSVDVNMSGCFDDPCEALVYVIREPMKAAAAAVVPAPAVAPTPATPNLANGLQFTMQVNPGNQSYDIWVGGLLRSAWLQPANVIVNFDYLNSITGQWSRAKAAPGSGYADAAGDVSVWRNFNSQTDPMDLSTLPLPMHFRIGN